MPENKPKYQFFTEADIDPQTGKVKSEYPMWYNPRLIEEMEDEVTTREMALKTNQVPPGQEAEFQNNLERIKGQLITMQNMTKLDDARNDKASLGKAVTELAKTIRAFMPKQSMCDRGLVDPNQEYQKLTKFHIDIQNDNQADLAQACNVPIKDGKITGEGANKMWKIGTKFLGEYANTETLRRM